MATFQGIRVSAEWRIILVEAWREGVHCKLNDGQRTIAMQEQRVREHGLYDPETNPTGAAYPDPSAPHIKHGQPNHAIDVDSSGNGENKLQVWLAHHGVTAVNNVSTERWHLDPIDLGQFINLAHKIKQRNRERNRYPTIRHKSGRNKHGHVTRLQRALRAVGYKSVKTTGKFDVRTRWAVARFKKKHHLKGGGKMVGKPFWLVIERVQRRGK